MASFAKLLGLSTAAVRVGNVTDVATGETAAGLRRRLVGAAGSAGVRVAVLANLGKTVTQARVQEMLDAVAGANGTLALAQIAQALAAAVGVPATSVAALRGPPPTLRNAPFSLPSAAPLAAAAAAAVAVTDNGAAAAGGAIGGFAALFIVLWLVRSHRKHGALPCFRDFAAERRKAEADAAAAREAAQIRLELEAVSKHNPLGGTGGGGGGGGGSGGSGGGGGGSSSSSSSIGALTIRGISARAADADRLEAELTRFKAQVAEQVRADAAGKGAALPATAKPPSRESFSPQGSA